MKKSILYFGLSLVMFNLSTGIFAQNNVDEKVKTQTNNRANTRVDQGIGKGLDAVEGGVKDLFKKKKPAYISVAGFLYSVIAECWRSGRGSNPRPPA